jgi:hypothetical protein
MELFGKEIDIDLDLKKLKLIILVGLGLGIVILITFLIILPIKTDLDKNKKLVSVKKEKISKDRELVRVEKKYEQISKEREKQNDRLYEVLKEFEEHSLKDEAQLKQMVQEILNYLDIKLIEIGKTEEDPDAGTLQYIEKMIPYTIAGNGRDIALFFYFLENGKGLLTLESGRIEMINKAYDDAKQEGGAVEVKFKLSYYKILTTAKEVKR